MAFGMPDVMKLSVIALVTVILALSMRKEAPAMAFTVVLIGGVLLVGQCIAVFQSLLKELSALIGESGVQTELLKPLLQLVGIATVVRVVSELCREAGSPSLAVKLELSGTAAALVVTLPLFSKVLKLIANLIA